MRRRHHRDGILRQGWEEVQTIDTRKHDQRTTLLRCCPSFATLRALKIYSHRQKWSVMCNSSTNSKAGTEERRRVERFTTSAQQATSSSRRQSTNNTTLRRAPARDRVVTEETKPACPHHGVSRSMLMTSAFRRSAGLSQQIGRTPLRHWEEVVTTAITTAKHWIRLC